MAPSITPPLETVSELVSAGIKHAIAKSASSITPHNGNISTLQELDAFKLVFTRNLNPKPVPETQLSRNNVNECVCKVPSVLILLSKHQSHNCRANHSYFSCTDHMITRFWNSTTGWQAPHLGPYVFCHSCPLPPSITTQLSVSKACGFTADTTPEPGFSVPIVIVTACSVQQSALPSQLLAPKSCSN